MTGNFYTNPLFISSVITSLVILIAYSYNTYQQKNNEREAKGLIYYFGLFVLSFGTSYGGAYIYNSLMSGGGGTVAIKDKVMKGGEKVVKSVKEVIEKVKPTTQNIVSETVTLGSQSGGSTDEFLNHGIPDW